MSIDHSNRLRTLQCLKRRGAELDRRIDAQLDRRTKLVLAAVQITKLFASASPTEIGPRTIRVQASSGQVDRSGEIVNQAGLHWSGSSVPCLWQHAPELPVGRAVPFFESGNLCATIEFAPPGISELVDEICALTKAGTITGVSIGFAPDEGGVEPMDASRPRGPLRYLSAELLEISLVSVAANPSASVVRRALKGGRWQGAASVPAVPCLSNFATAPAYQRAVEAFRKGQCDHTYQLVVSTEAPSYQQRRARVEQLRR